MDRRALHSLCVFSCTKQLSFRETFLPVGDCRFSFQGVCFASQKPRSGQSLSSARASNGNGRGRPLQKKTTTPERRTKKGSVGNTECSDERRTNTRKSNQEEILSLFKRIQSAISNEESLSVDEKTKKAGSFEDEPVTEALLDVIRQSRKQTKGDTNDGTDQDGSFLQPKREVRRARPPYNFTKRSPIPSPSDPRAKLVVPNRGDEFSETSEKEGKGLPLVENMKLVELKELAKSRGIKGYSKLKKRELVELLT